MDRYPHKVRAWEWLSAARAELEEFLKAYPGPEQETINLAIKQMRIAEGSDWFWWYGEDPDGSFDRLYRMHLKNFYLIIKKNPPDYLDFPLSAR